MKRILICAALMLALCLLGACAASDGMTTTSPSPSMAVTQSPTMQPEATDNTEDEGGEMPMESASPTAQGVTSATNARKAVEQIEDELERLSEVTDAQVVVAGNTAAVALKFDPQYQGGVDERMEKMVRERIDGVVSGVDHVVVTAEGELFDALDALGERMQDATDLADIQKELTEIVDRLKKTV